jgi:hypothetical protein
MLKPLTPFVYPDFTQELVRRHVGGGGGSAAAVVTG